ncbi:MAG TPA: ASCH domain-containing protein [Mycobacteriales bacterium]|nr:ASCH domain-containing protein [Mycobacteriales bacterium]
MWATSAEREVYETASRLAQSLPDDSRHTVAAAAMDTTGRIHTGVNVFHFTGGPCAELVLLGTAAAAGAGPLLIIVAMGRGDRGVIAPCGRCRQVLLDHHPDVHVIVPGPDLVPVRKLLPYAYHPPGVEAARIVRFSGRYFDDVAAGRKTITIRCDDSLSVGPAYFVFEDDAGVRRLDGRIETIEERRFDRLTVEDARRENVATVEELRTLLRGHYPDIADDAAVDVATFRTTG